MRFHPSILLGTWFFGTVLLHNKEETCRWLGAVMVLVGTMMFWWCRSTTNNERRTMTECRTPVTTVDSASVKVMRSYDYCHFEVCLSSSLNGGGGAIEQVDELRKAAARLADKAVAQYKIAKRNSERLLSDKCERAALIERVNRTRGIAEGDRTVKQQAELKAYDDEVYQSSRGYDYEDNWDEDQD